MINVLLKWILKRFAMFEKHHSLSDMYARLSTMVFISQVFNTALVVLIVNANLSYFGLDLQSDPLFGTLNLLVGECESRAESIIVSVGVQ